MFRNFHRKFLNKAIFYNIFSVLKSIRTHQKFLVRIFQRGTSDKLILPHLFIKGISINSKHLCCPDLIAVGLFKYDAEQRLFDL